MGKINLRIEWCGKTANVFFAKLFGLSAHAQPNEMMAWVESSILRFIIKEVF